MKLGFVGVGRWAGKIATAFRACGAEIVAHDRQNRKRCHGYGSPICDNGVWHRPDIGDVGCVHHCDAGYEWTEGFGRYQPWRDQLADKSIDAIVAVAPPETTTAVALACAEAGKACMATKPLFDHPKTIRAPFYVDFWRLWSEAHLDPHDLRTFSLYGSGPFRSFPGSFDYGPHVVAAVLDKFRHTDVEVTFAKSAESLKAHADGELFRVDFTCGSGHDSAKHIVAAMFGNASATAARSIWGREETPTHIGSEEKSAVLQRFCQSFLSDVSEGFVDTRLLELSRKGMAELRKIREMAGCS